MQEGEEEAERGWGGGDRERERENGCRFRLEAGEEKRGRSMRKRRERPGLRKSRGRKDDDDDDADFESLERVQILQATRKKHKGITSEDSALGKDFRKVSGEEGNETKEAGGSSDLDESRYGLQAFASEDQGNTKGHNTEEERMRKYVEDKLSNKAGAEGKAEQEEEKNLVSQLINRPKVSQPMNSKPKFNEFGRKKKKTLL